MGVETLAAVPVTLNGANVETPAGAVIVTVEPEEVALYPAVVHKPVIAAVQLLIAVLTLEAKVVVLLLAAAAADIIFLLLKVICVSVFPLEFVIFIVAIAGLG